MNDPLPTPTSTESRIQNLEEVYDTHSGRIINGAQYIGYGILIALFSFNKEEFFITYQALVISTALLAILFLVLLHTYTVYLFMASENLIKLHKPLTQKTSSEENSLRICNEVLEKQYQRTRTISLRIFWTFLAVLLLAVILFMISSFYYFWGRF